MTASVPLTPQAHGPAQPGTPVWDGPGRSESAGSGPSTPDQRSPGAARCRLAASHRPAPPADRLLGVFAWVTALGILGLVVALRGYAAIEAGVGPSWYEPALVTIGLIAVGLTVAGMLLADRLRLPWIMLGLATLPVSVNLLLTFTAV